MEPTIKLAGTEPWGSVELGSHGVLVDATAFRLGVNDDGDTVVSPENRHAIAALCLHGQPFGFTQQDVIDERLAYVNLVTLARQAQEMGDESMRLARIEQSRRHYERAAKIAALLPPSQ